MNGNNTLNSIQSIRRDIKNYLVHFTKDTATEVSFQILKNIISAKKLLGNTGMVKDSHNCICFSEAPLTEHISNFNLPNINPQIELRYQPFGLLFKKEFRFKQGGRPVIYQTSSEYSLLSQDLQYRHVTFEIGKTDFTWEREWRLKTDSLLFDYSDIHVLVPTQECSDELFSEFSTTNQEFGLSFDGSEPVYDNLGHSAEYNLKVISLDVLGLDY